MSYRLEKKFILHPAKYNDLIRFMKKIGIKKIYEDRKVFSTYYENDFFSSYNNSEEGVVPRKKIRIRTYNSDIHQDNSKFEIKITAEDNRFKIVLNKKKYLNKLNPLDKVYMDKTYGACKPILNVSYIRSYYLFSNCRMTVDRKIKYWKFSKNKKKIFEEPLNIVEFKSEVDNNLNLNNNVLYSQVTRFSKYCRGMNKVFFNIKNY